MSLDISNVLPLYLKLVCRLPALSNSSLMIKLCVMVQGIVQSGSLWCLLLPLTKLYHTIQNLGNLRCLVFLLSLTQVKFSLHSLSMAGRQLNNIGNVWVSVAPYSSRSVFSKHFLIPFLAQFPNKAFCWVLVGTLPFWCLPIDAVYSQVELEFCAWSDQFLCYIVYHWVWRVRILHKFVQCFMEVQLLHHGICFDKELFVARYLSVIVAMDRV